MSLCAIILKDLPEASFSSFSDRRADDSNKVGSRHYVGSIGHFWNTERKVMYQHNPGRIVSGERLQEGTYVEALRL